MKTIEFKTISYSGKDKTNEDYILCHKLSDNTLISILADGMGGLSYGAEAAIIVSESIMTTILSILRIVHRKMFCVWHSMQPILLYLKNARN